MKTRVACVTIGQSPRTDLIPDLRLYAGSSLELVEVGALDDLTAAEVAEHAPAPQEKSLVTRMRDGSEVVIGKAWVEARLQSLIDNLAFQPFDAIILLCTGHFPNLQVSAPLFLEAQRIVDSTTSGFLGAGAKLGVVVPLKRQISESHIRHQPTEFAFASPYQEEDFHARAESLRHCDLIVMHCIGYTESMRRCVAEATHKPVLLARRMVAAAIAQLA